MSRASEQRVQGLEQPEEEPLNGWGRRGLLSIAVNGDMDSEASLIGTLDVFISLKIEGEEGENGGMDQSGEKGVESCQSRCVKGKARVVVNCTGIGYNPREETERFDSNVGHFDQIGDQCCHIWYDVDSKSANLSKHDFLGQAYFTLGEVVGSLGSRSEKPLGGIQGKKCGTVIVKAEELNNCRESVMMQFCGNKLDKKDFFGKSDPFLVFYRSNEDGTFTICHKTEVVKNTLNPVWQAFKIPVRALCNGDYDRTIKVEVYDWDRDGSHDFIGEFSTSYRELSRGQSQFNVYEVVNPKKKGKKKKYLNSGTVTLLSFLVDIEVTFLDYIKGG
ncbi:Copine-8 [Collichthys lucidus]|uniref:Copine-8 n=1 Tax=Collichthys lucidus TaxID=240159 RepID=A0A4U5VQY9_COLLU|nr:Copine-8 [Collichthys lucidus]